MQKVFNLEQLPKIAKEIAQKLKNCDVITFSGPLGAGKTTLIGYILKEYGVNEQVISPTFTYLNIYKNAEGKSFVHFDLYRVKSIDEFLMAGFDEYLLAENSVCLIEWPEVIEELLKKLNKKVCNIILEYDTKTDRLIKF